MRRLNPNQAAARRRLAQKKYKRDGKTCSVTYLYLLGWDILITNLFAQTWTLHQIFALYPIRLQIEWLFRIWKSQLKIDHFGNWRAERVLCQLYAHLLGALLCQQLCVGWLWHSQQEFSLSKCVHIIQLRVTTLLTCLAHHWRGIHVWLQRLESTFQLFAPKTKRKKMPSTLQNLMLVFLS